MNAPRVIGAVNLNPGNAASFQFGDEFNSISNGYSTAMIIKSYSRVEFNGNHQANSVVPLVATDPTDHSHLFHAGNGTTAASFRGDANSAVPIVSFYNRGMDLQSVIDGQGRWDLTKVVNVLPAANLPTTVVPDNTAYAASWDSNLGSATKGALYAQMQLFATTTAQTTAVTTAKPKVFRTSTNNYTAATVIAANTWTTVQTAATTVAASSVGTEVFGMMNFTQTTGTMLVQVRVMVGAALTEVETRTCAANEVCSISLNQLMDTTQAAGSPAVVLQINVATATAITFNSKSVKAIHYY